MIVCSKCGKENEDHYKFCLGCGAEIVESSAAGTAHAQDVAAPSDPGELPPTEPPDDLAHADTCAQGAPSAGPSAKGVCPDCGAENPGGFAFCGRCGARIAPVPETLYRGKAPARPAVASGTDKPIGRILLIRPDGTPDGDHVLHAPETIVGRNSGPIFSGDGYLSPQHACFRLDGNGIIIQDLDSLNGVFVRITKPEPLTSGSILRIGQELLLFEVIGSPEPAEDGCQILGSPNPGYWGRLSLIVSEGIVGSAFPLMGDEMILGRERGDILFSDDGYVSAVHAKIAIDEVGTVILTDMGSSNGTFIRIREPRTLTAGAFILMGQQLFRLEMD